MFHRPHGFSRQVKATSDGFGCEEMLRFFLFLLILLKFDLLPQAFAEEWKQDLTSAMKIGISTTGYKRVDLKCEAEHFVVNFTLNDNFEGVVYTRGSFDSKKAPCFKTRDQNSKRENDELLISLKIPFHKCLTVMDVAESSYTNTIIVQHDPDLIMPGDAAFSLNCFFDPEFKDSSKTTNSISLKSQITLVDADPSNKEEEPINKNESLMSFSETEVVSFIPKNLQVLKNVKNEEL